MGYVDGDFPIGDPGKTVEADETFIGGYDAAVDGDDKAIVLGRARRRRDARGAGPHQGAYHSSYRPVRENGVAYQYGRSDQL
jgi:hypothetical protein